MHRKLILLVEDEPQDQALTLRVLRKHRAADEIVIANDGAEALELLYGTGTGRGAAIDPEIVLLDLKLPKVGGLEVLRRIRAEPRTRCVPVVMLTSSDEERDRRTSYELGANSYVQKPVEFAAFAKAVREVGVYWLEVNSPPPPPAYERG